MPLHSADPRFPQEQGNWPKPIPMHGYARLAAIFRSWVIAKRLGLLVLVYLILFTVSYGVAFFLRFDGRIEADIRSLFLSTIPWVAFIKLAVFYRFGSFHGWWRFVTFADLVTLLGVSTLSMLVVAAIDYFLIAQYQIPRSVLLLDWGVTVLLVGGLRSTWRITLEHVWPLIGFDDRRPVLLIGSGQSCEALARSIHGNPRLNYRVVGYLTEDASLHGTRLGGIPFLGSPVHAIVLAIDRRVRDILVTDESISGKRLRMLMEQCRQAELHLKMIPPVDALLNGSRHLQARDVNINDLLRRDPVTLDGELAANMLEGRRVMVTGAGGSIGSELCRQILDCRPVHVVLVERAENSLFYIEQELLRTHARSQFSAMIGDIGDADRMEAIFQRHRPEIVFHAAAHKHVPLMESNPGEAIKNNIGGTMLLVDLAIQHHVDRFVLISTDKAVNPTSVMGMTKRLLEQYICAVAESAAGKFVVVRFGNVLGSAGSVVPIFQEQIRRGGPVTVTHPDIERYFMTIPEASQLVLQAAAIGNGGEVLVLDMGEPVRILDLAKDLIRLSGYSSNEIEIEFTGLRPGEKMHEELFGDDEPTLPTAHRKVRKVKPLFARADDIVEAIKGIWPYIHDGDAMVRQKLREVVELRSKTSEPRLGDASFSMPEVPNATLLEPAETT
jgi:FlaA1/EpsC-like NDP-sugar epimerase